MGFKIGQNGKNFLFLRNKNIPFLNQAGAGGSAGSNFLLSWADGIFGRNDEAYYVLTASSVTRFAVDTIRDGARGVLIEASRSIYLTQSLYLASNWSALNGGTMLTGGSSAPGTSPDGTTPARINFGNVSTAQINQTIGAVSIPNTSSIAVDLFVRGVVGGEILRLRVDGKDGTQQAVDFTASTSWKRISNVRNVGSGGAGVIIRILNHTAATGYSVDVWGLCATAKAYSMSPSSRGNGSVAIQNPDVLTFLAAQVPLALREKKIRFYATPSWAPTDLSSSEERWLFSFGGPEFGYRCRHDGGAVRIDVISSSVILFSGSPMQGGRDVRREFILDPTSGSISLDGVTVSGSVWTMPGGVQMRVGGILTGNAEFDGTIEPPEAL